MSPRCGIWRAVYWKAQGYHVLSASNGQDALRVAREHKGAPIRLVVTDVIMPLMGGKVMAEWLKTTYPDLKILFTSGYTDDAIAQTRRAGAILLAWSFCQTLHARSVRRWRRRVVYSQQPVGVRPTGLGQF
jgi:CheY-like chemotaxis protein